MTSKRSTYHHGDLRSALLDAAEEILHEMGPHALNIREVARRAGVSHTAPYRHFTDKDELIRAVVERGFAQMRETILQAKARAPNDPVSQFSASGLAYIDFALNNPASYRIMFSGGLLSAHGTESLRNTGRDTFDELIQDVVTCQELGLLRPGDPLQQALAIISTVHGFVSLVHEGRIAMLLGPDHSLEDARNAILAAIFVGLAPS